MVVKRITLCKPRTCMYPSVGSKHERRNDARWDDVWMTDTDRRLGTVGRIREQYGEALKSSMATYSSRIDDLMQEPGGCS